MKKILLPLIVMVCSIEAAAQFTYQFTNFNSTNTPVFTGNNFKCIWVGKGNRIWAGTQYQGLYWFDTARQAWTKSAQLTNVFINQIQNDKNGGIWIAQSGTSGLQGGGSNTAGGVNYFPDTTDAGMQFFSTTGSTLSSRNVRGIYLDTVNTPAEDTRRIWVPQATFTTSGNTAAGGVSKWQYISSGNFQKNFLGLQVFPNTNLVSAGTPSCYTACGDRDEVWVGAETNYTIATGSTTQILRYDALTGQHLGGWDQNGAFDGTRLFYNNQPRVYTGDNSTVGVLPAGFRTTAMYCDREGRRWVGLRSGGVVVRIGSTWKNVNMPTVIMPGAMINFNAITSDEFGYIYIGTNNGLVIFDNGGDVTDTTFYKRLTTADGLPSNNITGVAYDKAGGRMLITSDAGVTFMKYNYRIKVDMEWDYSFPYRFNQPIGVAADGVSRIYLKVKKRSDTLPNIKEVTISLKDYTGIDNNIRGKLKKALVIDRYSEEASTGTSNTVTISDAEVRPGRPGEFWFWFVAPDDFSGDSTSEFSNLSRRYEKMTIIATYTDNKKDTQEYKIGVVRPPTLLVHGLASSPAAWDLLEHLNNGQFVKFINSPLFVYKRAITMDPIGYFHKNGAQLLGADVSAYQYADRLNTLQGNIEAMRNDMRYAANQVDYVCHSMGGIMIRSAIGFFPQKFYAGAGDDYLFKTYKKGYTHKIITINTPHNGAPIADVLDQFIPLTPTLLNHTLNLAYYHAPVFIGGFFKPVGNTGGPFAAFEATDAVNNLQVTAQRGGVNMLKTTNKFHMITGDLNWNSNYIEPLGIGTINYALAKVYKTLIQVIYASTYNSEEIDQSTAEETRAYLREIMAKPYETMIADFLNWMAAKRGYANYLADSDLIVPLMSQTAQLTIPKPYISVFTPTDMGTGTQGLNANHSAILWRHDVGQRVFQLLNSKMTSDLFGDEIPVDDDPEPQLLLRPSAGNAARPAAPTSIGVFYDTLKIKIDAPVMNAGVNADSTITVRFRLKDTTRLAYVSINFQGEDSFKMRKIFTQQSVTFKVDRSYLGSSKIFAYAVYDNAGGTGVNFHVDSVVLNATSVAPLQGFRVKEEVVNMTAGTPYIPNYEIQYNSEWFPLANDNSGIAVTIDSVNTVSYSAALKTFNGLKEGGAVATFTYGGFSDSVLIKVILPYYAGCINSTISGGSFKNPAIWSKGTVPGICDSIIISAGHTVTLDTSLTIRSLRINSTGTLNINNAAYTLKLGQGDDAFSIADNYGTLNISNGSLVVNGRVKHNGASTFTMSNGTLVIDGNKGQREISVGDGTALFEAAAGMTSFNFSGGTLQLNNPPYGVISQALNCPYDFGNNSTLVLGINTSSTASKNPDGFGGLLFPNKIGRLIVNAGTRNGNRQFVNKKALTVKGNAEVRTGSGVVLQAPITVNQ